MQRRFRCKACRAVIIVRPRGIADRMRYTATAIALALYRWSHEGCAGHDVAQQVSPRPLSLYTRQHGWRQVRRWNHAVKQIWGGLTLNSNRGGAGNGRHGGSAACGALPKRCDDDARSTMGWRALRLMVISDKHHKIHIHHSRQWFRGPSKIRIVACHNRHQRRPINDVEVLPKDHNEAVALFRA